MRRSWPTGGLLRKKKNLQVPSNADKFLTSRVIYGFSRRKVSQGVTCRYETVWWWQKKTADLGSCSHWGNPKLLFCDQQLMYSWPSSWLGGQSSWLLTMKSRVRFLNPQNTTVHVKTEMQIKCRLKKSRLYHVRFSLKGEDAHGDHGLGSW